jgi:hypothetical protein
MDIQKLAVSFYYIDNYCSGHKNSFRTLIFRPFLA